MIINNSTRAKHQKTGKEETNEIFFFIFVNHKLRFLTVGEQMITYYKSDDFTPILRNASYWASYNNVYYPIFRNYSKENEKAAVIPQLYSWLNSSRANIFRRDHDKVKDEESLMKLMR